MPRLFFLFALFCLFVCPPAGVFSQDLSLDEAVSLALENSEDIQKMRLDIEKMERVTEEARASRWFTVDAAFRYELDHLDKKNISVVNNPVNSTGDLIQRPYEMDVDVYTAEASVTVLQPVFTFGKISESIKAAKYALEASGHQEKAAERGMRYAARLLYYSALLSDEMLGIAQKSYKNALKSKKYLQNAAVSRPVKSDLIRVSADVALRKPGVDKARHAKNESYRALKILCDIPEDEVISLSDSLDDDFPRFSTDELGDTLEDHPELAALDFAGKMHQSRAHAKKAERYPEIIAFGGYVKDFESKKQDLDDYYGKEVTYVGLQINIPIWDHGKADARARQEKIESKKINLDILKKRKELRQKLNNAVEKHGAYRGVYKNQKLALTLSKKSYQTSLSRFENGQTSATELNDAETGLTMARRGLALALFELNALKAEILKLTGGL